MSEALDKNGGLALQTGHAMIWKSLGLFGSKGLFLVRTLVLAAILVPDDFGLLAIALVGVDVLTRITDLGFTQALIQREHVVDKHYDTTWTVNILRATLVGFVLIAMAPLIAQLFNEPRAEFLIQLVALRPLLLEAASIRIVEKQRVLNFQAVTLLKLVEAAVNTTIAIIFATQYGVMAMIAGMLAGAVSYMVLSYFVAPWKPRLHLDRSVSIQLIAFGQWLFYIALISVITGFLVRIFITRELGTAALGLYYLALRLALLPVELAEEVVGSVTFSLYSRMQSGIDGLREAFRTILVIFLSLLVPVSVLLIVLAPAIINSLLGEKWQGTESLVQYFAIAGLIGILGEAVVPLLKGIGRAMHVFITELLQSLTLIAGTWVFIHYMGVEGAAFAWIPAAGTSLLAILYFLYHTVSQPFSKLWFPIAMIAGVAAGSAILSSLIVHRITGITGLVIALVAAFAFVMVSYFIIDKKGIIGFSDVISRIYRGRRARQPAH